MDSKTPSSDNHNGSNEKGVGSQKERTSTDELSVVPSAQPEYRVYKRRWAGLFALVSLNLIAALGQPWFGPISNDGTSTRSFSTRRGANLISSGCTV